MSARFLMTLLASALATCASAQTINTYTQSPSGPNTLAYGLPVPLPVQSLTAVDGFRSFESLEARLQGLALNSSDLSAHDIGRSFNGRTLYAYVVGDENGSDVEGRPEAAFFINATTHAREWAAPEVAAGTIEHLIEGAEDEGLMRYLLDNTRLVIIPVHNLDGFLQTQRYPTQAIIGGDPDNASWPRDGRMRRKNMRNVDEVLTTFGDRLGGIDLNRNHPPFWATSVGNGSSPNPNSLTYHGAAAHSEPENQALRAAAQLGPSTRFRLGIDVHTFSRVFYSSNTARTRLNAVQAGLVDRLRTRQLALSGANYDNVPDPPNRGIGAAAEYFAYEWLVPAWTLELEPRTGPQEYGGLNVNHGGFILPAQEIRRVRDAWAETHALAFYIMAGPPHLAQLRVVDAESGATAVRSRWVYGASGDRSRVETPSGGGMVPGRRYRIELSFNKPMRFRDASGAIATLPGLAEVTRDPVVTLVRGGTRTPLDVSGGEWIDDPERGLRYRDDTFAFELVAPADLGDYTLEVAAQDMAGTALDANPATPADWSAGAWSQWEDESGIAGDTGSADRISGAIRTVASVQELRIVGAPTVAGEGSRYEVSIERVGSGDGLVSAWGTEPAVAGVIVGSPGPPRAFWSDGEVGVKRLIVEIGDDLEVQGDRTLSLPVSQLPDDTAASLLATLEVRILDNDEASRRVLNGQLASTIARAGGSPAPVDVVADGRVLAVFPSQATMVTGNILAYGNGALQATSDRRTQPLIEVAPGARLAIDRAGFEFGESPLTGAWPLFVVNGELELRRSRLLGRDTTNSFALGSGSIRIDRSTVRGNRAHPAAIHAGGDVVVSNSSFIQLDTHFNSNILTTGGPSSALLWSTFARGEIGAVIGTVDQGRVRLAGTLIQQFTAQAACTGSISSGGNNLLDRTDCALNGASDRLGVSVPLAAPAASADWIEPVGAALDWGSDCPPVDQRGAPRPQRSSANAPLACDIGAIEVGVNPYRGIWQPARSGHGVEIHTSGNRLLLVWYTYGADGQPTSYQAVAPLTGSHWEADLLQPQRNVQSGVVTTPVVGRVTLDFASDTDATLGWRFGASGSLGSERIRPSEFAYGEPGIEVSGVWYPPAESGYGATVTRRGETTALVLYYYDAQGKIRWVLGAGSAASATELTMQSFTGFCPDCDAAAMPVVGRDAGRVLVHFLTPERARLDTQITYPGANGGMWNRSNAALIPLNDLVDNSRTAPQPP